jgi:NTP pyrophosphatase (non-canonical NTP hydrolase)
MTDKPKTIEALQKQVDDYISQFDDGYWPPLSNLARLTEEVGELARELNDIFGDKPKKSASKADQDERLTEELGDLLFVVIVLANSLGVDLGEALDYVIEKYELRDRERFD